jgi:hypothetical protein
VSARLLNLSPLFAAHRVAQGLIAQLGPEYFAHRELDGLAFRVDADRLGRVVDMGAAEASERCPWLAVGEADLARARRHVQRLLVRALALRAQRPRRQRR